LQDTVVRHYQRDEADVVKSILRIRALEAMHQAEDLLLELPPLSPDHETVRLTVVRLEQTHRELSERNRVTDVVLGRSREVIDSAAKLIRAVRLGEHPNAERLRAAAATYKDENADSGEMATTIYGNNAPTPTTTVSSVVFLDMDTVLLATHPGRYGPELGVQADIDTAIDRLSVTADSIVVVVDPHASDKPNALDTEHRLEVLRRAMGERIEELTLATCPHAEADGCDCAKPGTGLVDRTMNERGFSHRGGWYITADQDGVVSGRTAGLRTIRIGPVGEDHLSAVHRPDYEARDLMDAANYIMFETPAG
jgi:histidinol phosphatase-like enzyme